MNILDDYYVFCTIDYAYKCASYVFLESLLMYNDYITVHVHCINFTEDQFAEYDKFVTDRWHGSVIAVKEDMEDIEYPSKQTHYYQRIVNTHGTALLSKCIIFGRKYKKYMFHLDVDMLIRQNFIEVFKAYEEQLIGNCYYYFAGVFNAGFLIINAGDVTIGENLHEWLQTYNKNDAVIVDEAYLQSFNFTTHYLPTSYCTVNTYRPRDIDTVKVVHFIGNTKPFFPKCVQKETMCILPYMKEWCDVFDRFDKEDVKDIYNIVEKNKKEISKYLDMSIRMYFPQLLNK